MLSSVTVLLAATGIAAAATIPVSVGMNGLTFEPNEIHAQQDDVIEFRFWPRNHSVVAGDFNNACRPAEENGFFSGFFPTQQGVNPQVFRVTVTHTNPMPIYCSQNTGQHCKNGMVAVINPADTGRLTLDAYAAAARNAGNATSPQGGAFGGQVAPNEAASGSATSGGGTASKTTTTTSTQTATDTAKSTETETQTQTESETATTAGTAGTATTGGATTTATNRPTATGNVAAGLAVPVAGLMAVAVGAFFV